MKRFILIISIIFISLSGFSQEVVSKDSTNILSEKIYNDVKQAIVGASQALKVGAENVYEIVKAQQAVNSIINLCVIVCGVLLTLLIFRYLKSTIKVVTKKDEKGKAIDWYYNKDSETWAFAHVLGGTMLAVIVVFTMVTIKNTITGFLNPDFGVINYLLEFIK